MWLHVCWAKPISIAWPSPQALVCFAVGEWSSASRPIHGCSATPVSIGWRSPQDDVYFVVDTMMFASLWIHGCLAMPVSTGGRSPQDDFCVLDFFLQIAQQYKSMMGLLLGLALPLFLRPRRPILVSFFLRESMQEQDTPGGVSSSLLIVFLSVS